MAEQDEFDGQTRGVRFIPEGVDETFDEMDSERPVIDAEFYDRQPRSSNTATDGEGDAIKGEPEEPKSELDLFFADLPSDKEVTIVVHRKPDANLTFRIPNKTDVHIENRIWGGETPDVVHQDIQSIHGGGRYRFQLRYGKGFSERKWEQVIADPPEHSLRERTMIADRAKADEPQRTPEPSPSFVPTPAAVPAAEQKSAFVEFKERLNEVQELKAALGIGDNTGTASPTLTAEEQIRIKVFDRLADNPDFSEKLIDYGFGIFKPKEKPESFIDLAKAAMKDPQGALSLIGGVLDLGKGLFFSDKRNAPAAPEPTAYAMPPGAVPSQPHVVPITTSAPAPSNLGLVPPEDDEPPAPVAETQPQANVEPLEPQEFVVWD